MSGMRGGFISLSRPGGRKGMNEDIKKLKTGLYLALLNKKVEELTDTEIDLIYVLAEDPDIKEQLEVANERRPKI